MVVHTKEEIYEAKQNFKSCIDSFKNCKKESNSPVNFIDTLSKSFLDEIKQKSFLNKQPRPFWINIIGLKKELEWESGM